MSSSADSSVSALNIRDIIEQGSVETHFQPITSIRKQSVIGLEALARGRDTGAGLISPGTLFGLADREQCTLDLDRLCRKTALESFAKVHGEAANGVELILFLNFHPSTVDKDGGESSELLNLIEQYHIDPGHVVIEVVEQEFGDVQMLRRALQLYKERGFLLALDDIGAGYSNLDRISFVKPDILKMDRSLVENIHNEYHKQEVFKSLVDLSEKIGGWIVVEGVECEAEALTALDLGGDIMQGFFFSRPQKLEGSNINPFNDNMNALAHKFRDYKLAQINTKRARHRRYQNAVRSLMNALQALTVDKFNTGLRSVIDEHEIIDCAFILDERGCQVSETVLSRLRQPRKKGLVFRPSPLGADHSLKEYFYLLIDSDLCQYTTQPYISTASGNPCVTISAQFQDTNKRTFVLCVDLDTERADVTISQQDHFPG